MNKFKKWLKAFVFGEDEANGKLHYISPDGKREFIAKIEKDIDSKQIKKITDILLEGKAIEE